MGTIVPKTYTLKTGETALVRSSKLADMSATREISLQAIREGEFVITEPDEFQASDEQQQQWLRQHAEDPGSLVLVAEVDSRVVGMLSFDRSSRRRLAHSGTLGITVDTDWREQGVGAALMLALLDWAEANPLIETVRLGVLANNSRAIHLYEKLGFIEEGRRLRAIKVAPGHYIDDIWMYRPVKETVATSAGAMSAAQLRTVAKRWMAEVWAERNVAAVDELHALDFVDRSPANRASDREAYKASIAELYAAFPDWRATTDDLVVDVSASKVAIRWTASGTHLGAFLSFAPTGKPVTFHGIEILHIANSLIIERWGEWDSLTLEEQLRG